LKNKQKQKEWDNPINYTEYNEAKLHQIIKETKVQTRKANQNRNLRYTGKFRGKVEPEEEPIVE